MSGVISTFLKERDKSLAQFVFLETDEKKKHNIYSRLVKDIERIQMVELREKVKKFDPAYELIGHVLPRCMVNNHLKYIYGKTHRVCPRCDGTGTAVGVTIEPCDKCKGKLVVETEPPEGYSVIYASFIEVDLKRDCKTIDHGIYADFAWLSADTTPVSKDWIILSDSEDGIYEKLSTLFPYDSENDRRLKSYRQAMPILIANHLLEPYATDNNGCRWSMITEDLVLYDMMTSEIMCMGNWWKIHSMVMINTFSDIEHTAHRYAVERRSRFLDKYKIVSSSRLDTLYSRIILDALTMYVPHASYGGAKETAGMYINTYNSMTAVTENIHKHLPHPGMCFSHDNIMPILEKIQADFSLIGIKIGAAEAAGIIKDIAKLTHEDTAIILVKSNNAVAVWLIEYVIISLEYANISATDDTHRNAANSCEAMFMNGA